LNPFHDKGHVKETLILKPIQVLGCSQKDSKASRRKGFTQGGEHKLKPLSFIPLFLFKRVTTAPYWCDKGFTVLQALLSRQRVVDPQARPGLEAYYEG
jgi:hypothetical protein